MQARNKYTPLAIMALAVGLLVAGCAKEEPVGPAEVAPALRSKVRNLVPVPPPTGRDSIAPISDDGDDLGDKERSTPNKR